MKPISQFVIDKMFNDIPNLKKAIMCLNEECQDRFVEILVDADIDISTLPRKIKRYDGIIYTIKSANYLKDEIIATSVGTDIRYFSNQDDADEFAKSGYFDFTKSNYQEDIVYTIKGEHLVKKETWFSYDIWMNSEIVED